MKAPWKFLFGLFFAGVLIYATFGAIERIADIRNSVKITDAEKIGVSRRLVLEGKALLRQEKYMEAEQKFIAADDPKYWLYEGRPSGTARAWLRAALVAQGKYEVALESVQGNLLIIPDHQPSLDEQLVYKAMIKSRDSKDTKSIYDAINALRTKYANILPPQQYIGIGSLSTIATILRLYDTIADYDAGIAYIDETMEYFKKKDTEKYGEYKPGKVDLEYLKVREGFEQDKAESRGSCLGKPGCVGRASKALIQSDYFPW